MKIHELLTLNTIKIPLESTDKDTLLNELVQLLPVDDNVLSKEKILFEILEREKLCSTGIGEGIAIPHTKLTEISEEVLLSFGICKKPVDFDSSDEKPVSICFMLLSRKNATGPHLRTLAAIARYLKNPELKEALLSCTKAEQIIELFKNHEEKSAS